VVTVVKEHQDQLVSRLRRVLCGETKPCIRKRMTSSPWARSPFPSWSAERDVALILLDGRPAMTIVIVDPRRTPDEGRQITLVMNCSAEGEEMRGDVMK
jgi:hypothetical protein